MAPETNSTPKVPCQPEVEQFFTAFYLELHKLASSVLRHDGNATINPTALVNEAFLKLQRSPDFASRSGEHRIAIAARAMRQVLVDAARRRQARKREGAAMQFATVADVPEEKALSAEELLALNQALDKLAQLNPRQAQMVELRFFGGQNVAETAEVLGVAITTVERDWVAVKAWLAKEIRGFN